MAIAVLGIDLGKNSCSVAGRDGTGRVVLRRRLTRESVVRLAGTLPACVVAMEACCGAHHLGRVLREQGHEVRLMPPEYVQPGGDRPATLSPRTCLLIEDMRLEWSELDRRIAALTAEFVARAREDQAARRLAPIPGFGALHATARVAAIGTGETFRRGRDLAAWLGLVPRQATTGGKPRLLGITKRGNTYLRTLLIHGARAALPSLSASQSRMGEWLRGLIGRAHKNKVIVALAGKLARIAWAVLRSGETYVKEGRPVAA